MAAGSVIIDLLCRTSSFETDTKRAEKRLAELKKEAQAMGVAVGAAFAAVGAASVAMVKSAIDAADEMGKMAQKAGVTVEEFSALAYAADLAGVSQDQLGSAMVKLSKNMSDAADGTGEAVKGFDALGISVKNADGSLKTSDQILAEVADKFAQLPDGVDKTTAAVNIFGRAGADLIPLLNGGSSGLAEMRDEAQQLGVILTTEASKAAEEFNDNLSRMGAAVSGVANQAAGELLPALNDVSSMLVEVAKNEASMGVATDIVKAAVGGLITVFQTVAVVGSDVGFVFMSVGREIGAWAAQLGALARGDLNGFRAISDAVKADGERARAELDKFQARVMAIGQSGAAPYRDPRLLGEVGSIRSQTAGWSRVAPPGRAAGGGSGGRPAADKAAADAARAALKEEQALLEMRRASAIAAGDAVTRANEEYQSLLDRLMDDTPTKRLQEQRQEMAFLADAFTEGRITEQEYTEAVTHRLGLVAEKTTEAKTMAEEFGMTFTSALEDAVLGGGDLSDVFKGLLQDIARVILRMQVMEPLMKSISGGGGPPANPFASGGGGGGGWGETIINAIGSYFGGPRANGGPVEAGKAYVVGERRAELFVPRTAGAILPSVPTGGGDKVTLINQTTGRVDRVVEQRISPTERALILQEAVEAVAGQLSQPTSRIGKSLRGNYDVRRKF